MQCSEERIVVILDWYSGHRTPDVEDVVRRKGHVLLFHGGGYIAIGLMVAVWQSGSPQPTAVRQIIVFFK